MPAIVNRVRDLVARVTGRTEISAIESRLDLMEYRMGHLAASYRGDYYQKSRRLTMEEYWSAHNVTAHARFASAAESLSHFHRRNQQYPGYIEMLPVAGQDGKVVLDYGCGPGNDLVGFAHYSKPGRLVGIDVSRVSLEQARDRLALHGVTPELLHVPYGQYEVPLASASVDYLHCSGVLMLIEDPMRLLKEFARVLKPTGELRLMIYNYDSVWLHLYVAYVLQLEYGLYADVDVRSAFSRTTDGEDCPLVHIWNAEEMSAIATEAGFRSEFLGAALSLWELHLLPHRFKAAMDQRLALEHRDFLLSLQLDGHGFPLHRGRYAGIDGCYRFVPRA